MSLALPHNLPAAIDDGAADHLHGMAVAAIPLPAMRLPTFEFEPYLGQSSTHLKRLAMVIRDGCIIKVFYPVLPPDRNAAVVIEWLERRGKTGQLT